MAKPQITIINAESGEEITRDATAAEIAQIKSDAEQSKVEKDAADAKATAKQSILDRIGLTADELKTILG
jgi:uncharacterized protein YPO0396